MPIHPRAIVHPSAFVHPSSAIGPFVVIDGPVQIGPDCQISASAIIYGHTEIGAGCRIHSHAVIGDIPQDRAYDGSVSFCRIGDRCLIREGATVHRATGEGEATVVGNGCHLMTNSHIAHNCVLGENVTVISGALLGGHVQVGNRAVISGNAAIHQFVRIGELSMISGLAKIVQDIPPFLMTDREGNVVGLNLVGLVRAGVPSETRHELKALFKLMYRSGMPSQLALAMAQEIATTEMGQRFVSFLMCGSHRGIARDAERKRHSA